jgi:hypothetical protein
MMSTKTDNTTAASSSDATGGVVRDTKCEGWMLKKSRHFGIWRQRWCVIDGTRLITYRDEHSLDVPTATIDLRVFCNFLSLGVSDNGYTFALQQIVPKKDSIQFEFAVRTEIEFKAWKKHLTQAVGRATE